MYRHACRLLVLLVLGAVTSVAVAWSCAAWSSPDATDTVVDFAYGGGPHVHERFRRSGFGVKWVWLRTAPGQSARTARRLPASMSRLEAAPPAVGIPRRTRVENSFLLAGWPMPCLMSEAVAGLGRANSGPILVPWQDAIEYRPPLPGDPYSAGILPGRPVAGGLAVNTVVFAGAWLLLLAAFQGGVRRWRRRRGVCPRCRYDLRGGGSRACPECGASLVCDTVSTPAEAEPTQT